MWRRILFAMAAQEAKTAKVIEVERKFLLQDGITDKIRKLGAEHIQTKTFTDSYYDTRSHSITLADHWLRKRDGSWQLKSPPPTSHDSLTTAQYVETENESDIVEVLSNLLRTEEQLNEKQHKTLSEMVAEFEIKEFAQFKTERASYKLRDLRIDLDQADFGFKVGEIEKLVSSEEQVTECLKEIDALAVELGLTGGKRIMGKVGTYLQLKDPAHLQLLRDRGGLM